LGKLTNHYNLPQQIVSAVKRDPYQGFRASDITTTSLIQPPRIFQLRKRHGEEIEEDASDRIWSLLGQIVHGILERADDTDAFHEERIKIFVNGWSLSGQTDVYNTKEVIGYTKTGRPRYKKSAPAVRDYKFIRVTAGRCLHDEWESQLNINAHLWRSHGFKVDKVEIIAIYRDWSKMMAQRDSKYPPPVQVFPQKLWSHHEADLFIQGRVLAHQQAEKLPDHLLPFCTPAEQWRRDQKWAVMKPKRAKALVLKPTKEEADRYIAELGDRAAYIEFRPGTPTRCENFCDVRPWCNQFEMESGQAARREQSA
jgi:hypothetical protein